MGPSDGDGDDDEELGGLATVGLAPVASELEGDGFGVSPPHDAAANVAVTNNTSARLHIVGMLSAPT